MDEQRKEWLRKRGPWIALPVIAALAFAAGTCLGGDDDAPAAEGAHEGDEGDEHASSDEDTVWTCSMHPQIRQPEPGDCPICGMDLIPASQDEGGGAAERDPKQITLSERAMMLARIRTASVKRLEAGSVERRLLGRVEYDETTLRTVTAWTGGRIDRLHVQVTGQRVRRNQTIATLYSPEVYEAQQDLMQAVRQGGPNAEQEGMRATTKAALRATRQRLRLLGVPDGTIERMEKAEAPWRHIPIRTPFGGTVVERLATEGQYVQTGTGLYRIADLSQLWVQLDAYEKDLPLLSEGQEVTLEVEALPGKELEGKVAFIDPVIDSRTRTAKVRIEVGNPDRKLRPGMFAEAVVEASTDQIGESPLVIPGSAPLFTGRRSLVYVEVPNAEQPTYEARVVKLGPKMGSVYPVIAGLSEGERVVEHGAFTLDADLQIRGGVSMMSTADDTEPGPYDDIVRVPAAFREELGEHLAPYLKLQTALADDDLAAAKEAAEELGASVPTFDPKEPLQGRRAWKPIAEALAGHAHHLTQADSLDAARRAFENLTQPMLRILRVFGNPFDRPIHLAHCPMAFDDEGADWLQAEQAINNVYFGEKMRTCGEIRATVGAGEYLPGGAAARATAAPAGGHSH